MVMEYDEHTDDETIERITTLHETIVNNHKDFDVQDLDEFEERVKVMPVGDDGSVVAFIEGD